MAQVNWNQVLSLSDNMCGQDDKGNLVEIIFVRPFVKWRIPGTQNGVCTNPFGHLAVRYTYQGKDIIANIDPKPKDLVTFYDVVDYLFSEENPQKGFTHRDMYGVRKYGISENQIAILHHYLQDVDRLNKERKNQFSLHIGLFLNNFHSEFFEFAERGNCSLWTTKGLEIANIIPKRTIFPKRALMNAFELGDENTHLVRYKKQPNENMEYGQDGSPLEITDYTLTGSLFYTNLSRYCTLEIDLTEEGAVITENPEPKPPSTLRYYTNTTARWVAPTLLTAYTIKKVGPIAMTWADRTTHKVHTGWQYARNAISGLRKVFRK